MNTQIEQALRRALAAQAAELPADASLELLARDYRPRGYRPRRIVGSGALAIAAATVAAGAVLAISVGLGTDAPRAFAGWSATPTPTVGDQAQKAAATCRSQLAGLPGREHATAGRARFPIPGVPARGWHAVLVDTRGPYTTVVFEVDRGRAVSTCFVDRGRASAGTSVGKHPPTPVPAGEIAYAGSGSTTTPPDDGSHQFSWVVGRTGPGVTAVTLRLINGTRVTASHANGWFLAWWPGSHGLSATEVTTPTGTRDQ
jgi:hypothetical protein